MKNYTIAVAGTGYVGLSIATLLSQHHQVTAVDVIPEKIEKINHRISPIQDEYIEKYLAENISIKEEYYYTKKNIIEEKGETQKNILPIKKNIGNPEPIFLP